MDTHRSATPLHRLSLLETAVADLERHMREVEDALAQAGFAVPGDALPVSAPPATTVLSDRAEPAATAAFSGALVEPPNKPTTLLADEPPAPPTAALPQEAAPPADARLPAALPRWMVDSLPETADEDALPPPARPPSRPAFRGDVLRGSEFWLNKIGIGLLLFGVAFLFKYAVDQGWLTQEIRVLFGLGIGAVLLAFGLRLYEDRPHFSQVLLGGSVASFYITGYAAFQLFHLPFAPYAATFSFMVAVTLLAFVLAARQNAFVLALIGTVGGLATPFVLYTGEQGIEALTAYTCLVTAGALAIYFYRGWHSLLWTGFAGCWAVLCTAALSYSSAWPPYPLTGQWALLGGCAFGWLAFGAVPVLRDLLWTRAPARWQHPSLDVLAGAFRRSPADRLDPHVHVLSLITPLVALGLAGAVAPWGQQIWGAIVLAGFVVYAVAYWTLRPRHPVLAYTHALLGSLLLTLALILLLDGDALFFALAAEAAALHFAARRLRLTAVTVAAHLLFAAVAWWLGVRLDGNNLIAGLDLSAARATDLAVIALAFASATAQTRREIAWAYRFAAYLAGFGWLWAVLGHIQDNVPGGYLLLAWAAYAALLLLLARRPADRGAPEQPTDSAALVAGHLGFAGVIALFGARLLLGHPLDYGLSTGLAALGTPGEWPVFNLMGLTNLAVILVLAAVWPRLRSVEERLVYALAVYQLTLGWLWQELSMLPQGGDYVILAWAACATAVLVAVYRWPDAPAAFTSIARPLALSAHSTLASLGVLLALRIATGPQGALAIFNAKALVDLAVMGLALLVASLSPKLARYYCFAIHVAVLGWLARELSALPDGAGYITAAWGLYAVALFLVGLRRSQNLVLYTGLGTLLLVVGKLILVDLSMVDEIWRILLFLGFGGLFLVLSYYVQSWLRRRPDPAPGSP